jgi:hypothetical protein
MLQILYVCVNRNTTCLTGRLYTLAFPAAAYLHSFFSLCIQRLQYCLYNFGRSLQLLQSVPVYCLYTRSGRLQLLHPLQCIQPLSFFSAIATSTAFTASADFADSTSFAACIASTSKKPFSPTSTVLTPPASSASVHRLCSLDAHIYILDGCSSLYGLNRLEVISSSTPPQPQKYKRKEGRPFKKRE